MAHGRSRNSPVLTSTASRGCGESGDIARFRASRRRLPMTAGCGTRRARQQSGAQLLRFKSPARARSSPHVTDMTTFTRILGLTTLLAGIVLVGYWRMSASQKDRAIAELRELNQQMEHALAQRQAMVERLSRSRRVAHVRVTDQR